MTKALRLSLDNWKQTNRHKIEMNKIEPNEIEKSETNYSKTKISFYCLGILWWNIIKLAFHPN